MNVPARTIPEGPAAQPADPSPAHLAEEIIRLLSGPASDHPTAFAHLLAAVDLADAGITEVAVVGDRPEMVTTVQARYLPRAVLAWGERYPSPLLEGRDPGFAYVCRDYACQRPAAAA